MDDARANKIASAKKLLKNFQQKKTDSKPSTSDVVVKTETGQQETVHDPSEHRIQHTDALRPADLQSDRLNEVANLPMFTFPTDSTTTSFSEYLGFGGGRRSSDQRGVGNETAAVATQDPAPATVAPPTAERQSPVASGASPTSSFTFASQEGGTGAHSSTNSTSSRHSDWEYVAAGGAADLHKLQDVVESVTADAADNLTSETLRRLSDRLSQMTADGVPAVESEAAGESAAEVRCAQLAAAAERGRSQLLVSSQQTEHLRSRVQELEAELEEERGGFERRYQSSQQQLVVQAQTVDALTAESGELRSRLLAAESTIRQLQEELTAGESVQQLQSLYAEADNERNRSREQCGELQQQLEEARQQLRDELQRAGDETRQLAGLRDAAAEEFRLHTTALQQRVEEAERERSEAEEALKETQCRQQQTEAPSPRAVEEQRERMLERQMWQQERRQLKESIQTQDQQLLHVRTELAEVSAESGRLAAVNAQLKSTVEELEMRVDRCTAGTVDTAQLCRDLEDNRVALSRAMLQNKQLKDQLQLLQQSLNTEADRKLELTESLRSEQETVDRLSGRLTELQTALDRCTGRADTAERQLISTQLQVDQLQHYRAVGLQAERLQAELTVARQQLAAAAGKPPAVVESSTAPESVVTTAAVHPAPSSCEDAHLPTSRLLRPPVDDVIREREELRARLNQFLAGGAVDPAEHEQLRSELVQLEQRYHALMDQLTAALHDKQQMEHLCTQLQCETDTIGEYISLYQTQRAALRQQAVERQQEMRTLHEDRCQLRQQLHQLQLLVAGTEEDRGQQEVEPVEALPAAPEVSQQRTDTARRIASLVEQIGNSEYVHGHVAGLHVCQHCRGKRILNV